MERKNNAWQFPWRKPIPRTAEGHMFLPVHLGKVYRKTLFYKAHIIPVYHKTERQMKNDKDEKQSSNGGTSSGRWTLTQIGLVDTETTDWKTQLFQGMQIWEVPEAQKTHFML